MYDTAYHLMPSTRRNRFHDADESFLESVGLWRDVGTAARIDARLLWHRGSSGPAGSLGQRTGDCCMGVTGRQAKRIRGQCFGAWAVGATRGGCPYSRWETICHGG